MKEQVEGGDRKQGVSPIYEIGSEVPGGRLKRVKKKLVGVSFTKFGLYRGGGNMPKEGKSTRGVLGKVPEF